MSKCKQEKKLRKLLKKQITGNYYCDPDPENNDECEKWEPFEFWDDERIEEQIETDVESMFKFITKNKKTILEFFANNG